MYTYIDIFSVLISNKANIDRYNLHKQKLSGAHNTFSSNTVKGSWDQIVWELLP